MKPAVLLCAAAVALAGFGGGAGPADRGVSLTVSGAGSRLTLGCAPAHGSIPFAARLCADVRAHPMAMLGPAAPRAECRGRGGTGHVEVRVVAGGIRTTFGGPPARPCAWPLSGSLELYAAAAARDGRRLAAAEQNLGCLEDPALLVQPTPWTLVYDCMGWPRSEAETNDTTLLLERYPWLATRMRRAVFDFFGGVHPISARLIDYDRRVDQRIVVIYEFARSVDCLTCSDDPTALASTTGRVFRVSYDRETRRGLVTRLCDTVKACR